MKKLIAIHPNQDNTIIITNKTTRLLSDNLTYAICYIIEKDDARYTYRGVGYDKATGSIKQGPCSELAINYDDGSEWHYFNILINDEGFINEGACDKLIIKDNNTILTLSQISIDQDGYPKPGLCHEYNIISPEGKEVTWQEVYINNDFEILPDCFCKSLILKHESGRVFSFKNLYLNEDGFPKNEHQFDFNSDFFTYFPQTSPGSDVEVKLQQDL
ncbi:hypothetical protein DID75_02645 [Candidatus Marinamargulisbacteria bacterium SCGC AG-410-N11]|nr:hypothetical protein DID75_02645 [Candidatus Marinamargulisbacteria bacterium SCGC AG-410-N11]